jgi:hypothetical protein
LGNECKVARAGRGALHGWPKTDSFHRLHNQQISNPTRKWKGVLDGPEESHGAKSLIARVVMNTQQ